MYTLSRFINLSVMSFVGTVERITVTAKPWWVRLSLQDIIALYAPHMVLAAAISAAAVIAYDPTLKILLISALPQDWRTSTVFYLCLAEEVRNLVLMGIISVPVLQLHVMTSDLLVEALDEIAHSFLTA